FCSHVLPFLANPSWISFSTFTDSLNAVPRGTHCTAANVITSLYLCKTLYSGIVLFCSLTLLASFPSVCHANAFCAVCNNNYLIKQPVVAVTLLMLAPLIRPSMRDVDPKSNQFSWPES